MSGRLISRLLKDPEPTGSARLVLVVIASHARDDGTGAELAVATIAREAGMTTERAARQSISKLTKAGYLTASPRPRRVNLWTVHPGAVNPEGIFPHQPGTNVPPSAAVNPEGIFPPTRNESSPTTRKERSPTSTTGVKEPASEPRFSADELRIPATDPRRPVAELLTGRYRYRTVTDAQWDVLHEVVDNEYPSGTSKGADPRAGWRWLAEELAALPRDAGDPLSAFLNSYNRVLDERRSRASA